MDYKQKYNEALARARDMMSYKEVRREDMEYLFPELKESEDEKIRKQIISFLKEFEYDHYRSLDFSSWIAWLEKQDEQKYSWSEEDEKKRTLLIRILEVNHPNGYFKVNPANTSNIEAIHTEELVSWLKSIRPQNRWTPSDKQGEQKLINTDFKAKDCYVSKVDGKIHIVGKFEPKFKAGDWIVWKDKCYKVNYNGCGYELVDQNGLSTSLEYGTIDENAHLWTIEDAKDGDVLVFEGYYNSIVLFQGIGINGKGRINYHCKCDLGNYSFGIQGDVACLGTIEKDAEHYKPATKEQRDLLFQRIKDEGYEWNADEKVLNKVIIYE